MKVQTKDTQISNIRVLAIFLVVLGHSIIIYSSSWDIYETIWKIPFLDWFKKVIDIPQMPIFFSLSGFLFVFTHEKNLGILKLIKSKTQRLLIPYFCVWILYLLPLRLLIDFESYQNSGIIDILKKLINASDVGHLWYLATLFVVFLLSEIVLTIAEKIPYIGKKPEIFLCVIAIVLYLQGYRIGFGYPPLLGAFNYLIWFALGYMINRFQNIFLGIYRYTIIKVFMITINIVFIIISLNNNYWMWMLLAKTLCVLNAYGVTMKSKNSFMEKIDRNSFGIYLFHSPLIYITFAYIPNVHPIIVIMINLIGFGLIAFLLTELMRKTKLRFIIGEKI